MSELAQASTHIHLRKDQSLWRPGDAATQFYLVTAGLVKRTALSYSGNERVLDLLMPDDYLGVSELLAARSYGTHAIAVKPTVLLAIDGDVFHTILAQVPAVGQHLGQWLAIRHLQGEEETAAQHSRPSSERLLNFLLQRISGNLPTTGETTLRLPASKQLLAARIGITPETFSRALRELGDAGLVIVHGNLVRLQNGPLTLRQLSLLPAQNSRSSTSLIPLNSVINIAGRQRMLSQRMAKFWLMAVCGLSPVRARRNLSLSIDVFESQRRQLEEFPAESNIKALRQELDKLWSHYRLLLEKPPIPSQTKALFTLNEDILSVAEAQTHAYTLLHPSESGALINIAGRQRMLAQRIAKFYLFQHCGTNVTDSRIGVTEASAAFSDTLKRLRANAKIEDVTQSLDNVQQLWEQLTQIIATSISELTERTRRAAAICDLSEELVRQMDRAVYHYERQTDPPPSRRD